MDDRKLLQLAAASASVEVATWSNCQAGGFLHGQSGKFWNPLTDDGDALRLAVKLHLLVQVRDRVTIVTDKAGLQLAFRPHKDDPEAATRYAITRAAAALNRPQ